MKDQIKALAANPTYAAAKTFAYSYLGFTLYLSFTHQIELFAHMGSHSPWVAPILCDTLMVFGKMLRNPKKISAGGRRAGGFLQYFGAALSLTANILAGDNAGDRIIGAMVISLMLIIEAVADHIKPIEKDTAVAKKAKTAAAVAKAQATRAANQAKAQREVEAKAQREADRKERARLNRLAREAEAKAAATETDQRPTDLNAWAADASAPVSPAPAGWTYI
jgi:hypothetical protein